MLSTVWTAQRCSRSYTEKRRGRKETEVARRIKRGIKRRETDPAVISSLSVLHCPEHTKRFTELGKEEKGEGIDRGDLVEDSENSPDHKGSYCFLCQLYHNHRVCKHLWLKDLHQLVGKSNPYTAHSSFLRQGKVMHYDFQFIKIGCIIQN